jgi:diacylglycerol kinase family enzyme
VANLGLVRRMLSKRANVKAAHVVRDDDVAWLQVTSDTPIATQIDGDYLGLREEMTFRSVPGALDVVAPPQKSS